MPVLGYLDELVVLPVGIALAVRLIPTDLMAEYRREAASRKVRPRSLMAALIIILIWTLVLFVLSYCVYQHIR
ncbi:hypothetical protein [Sinorhizobium saheli]|uniref:hypothetical protein n=1 Tax=Sinorhizobium saheli TaxID=36856 RepID=UPI00389ADDAE